MTSLVNQPKVAELEAERILDMFMKRQKPVQLSTRSSIDRIAALANWLVNASGRLVARACDTQKALMSMIAAAICKRQVEIERTSAGKTLFTPAASR